MALIISVIAESERFLKKKKFFFFAIIQECDPKQISSDSFKVLISAISEQLKAEKQTGLRDKVTVNYQHWMRYLCVQEQL